MRSKRIRIIAVVAAAVAAVAAFPAQAGYLARMLLVAWAVAATLEPMCDALSKKLSREASAWLSLCAAVLLLCAAAFALLPALARQTREMVKMLPSLMSKANDMLALLNVRLEKMGLNKLNAREFDAAGWAMDALNGAFASAGSVAQGAAAFFLSAILGVFILIDIDRARFTVEMMIPVKWRKLAVRMSRDVSLGLKMYVKGQVTVSVIVGAVSAGALWLIGVNAPVALGAIIGIFNIIPYFGPIFGGVPAVVIALSQSLITALFCVAALFAVQQIDSMFISPRVMSSATGLRPTSTVIAMAIGGAGWGPMGMLLALPMAIIIKIAMRTWASRND